jgi:hypothetical protein
MSEKQREDPDIAPIVQALKSEAKPLGSDMERESPATRQYWVLWDSLFIKDKVLYRQFRKKNGTDCYEQVIVQKCLRRDTLSEMHDSILAGHLGSKKTKHRIQSNFYWYGLKGDVNLFVKTYDACKSDKSMQKPPRGQMGHLQSGAPWDTLAIDYLGPLPVTENGNKYIMVLTDHFTKYVEVLAVPNQLAEDCALKIANEFVSRWGMPLKIHTDQGSTFESKNCVLYFRLKRAARFPEIQNVMVKLNDTIRRY